MKIKYIALSIGIITSSPYAISANDAGKTVKNSVAFGASSEANGFTSVAIGTSSKAMVGSSVAIGASSEAHKWSTVAVGDSSKAKGQSSVAIGDASEANGLASVAIGELSNVGGKPTYKDAVSFDPVNNGNFGIAIGSESQANELSTSIGAFSKATSTSSMAIGPKALTKDGDYSIAIGAKAFISPLEEGTGIEYSDKEIKKDNGNIEINIKNSKTREELIEKHGKAYGAIAVGLGASSHDLFNTSLGSFSTAAAEDTVAVGYNAVAKEKNSIALGNKSVADRENSVSVGAKDNQRQITNVANGEDDYDAVNISQLKNEIKQRKDGDKETLENAAIYTDRKVENISTEVSNNVINKSSEYTNNKFKEANVYTDIKFNQLKSEINKVDKKINRGLASSAALSGLFQPYSVGKFNITAGVGGFRDESAIAVGTGYRFNENVAAKAGMSSSTGNTSSIMYNASMNIEW